MSCLNSVELPEPTKTSPFPPPLFRVHQSAPDFAGQRQLLDCIPFLVPLVSPTLWRERID